MAEGVEGIAESDTEFDETSAAEAPHPESPASVEGRGRFSTGGAADDGIANHARARPDGSGILGLQNDVYLAKAGPSKPKPANPPPATKPRSLGLLKSESNAFVNVKIDAEVVADGSDYLGSGSALTKFPIPDYDNPSSFNTAGGKVTSSVGTFEWTGTITIQTTYEHGKPTGLSSYGRGTTKIDVKNRDITLGFHENCHQRDCERYLKNNPLPDPPKLKVGMTLKKALSELARFKKAYDRYVVELSRYTYKRPDQVGYKKSTWKKNDKKPYKHKVP
jgi:hypothetical protein